ncbi:S53 family peptidase [Sciscionella marina]|uniref:S53 family peptidase n=1 Tax=Sciscionella marina TaxID=508770 RepID=UPI003B82D5F7
MVAGGAVLAGLIATPALAENTANTTRAPIAGTTPGWATAAAQSGTIDTGQVRHVHVALALRDPQGAARMAKAVSTPGTPQYRHPFSADQFRDRFAPSTETVNRVAHWLRDQGVTVDGQSSNRQFLDVTANVGTLEHAFGTRLHTYHHIDQHGRAEQLTAPGAPISVPTALRTSIRTVLGLDDSERAVTQSAHGPSTSTAAGPGQQCAKYWGQANNTAVPQKYGHGDQSNAICGYNYKQLRDMYGLKDSQTGKGAKVGIVGAYDSPTTVADANRAATQFGAPQLRGDQYNTVPPKSGYVSNPQCGSKDSWTGEQALDVQAVHTMAPDAHITYYGGKDCTGLYEALNNAVAANHVSIINNSWLSPNETQIPAATRDALGQITVQAAAQGQSLLFSSGDSGDNSGVNGKATATFPASNPWVTAVGGTTVALDAKNTKRFTTGWESAGNTLNGGRWSPQQDKDGAFAGGAGGGMSGVYEEPDYQRKAIPDSAAAGHRAFPDVSALADAYTGMGVGYTTEQGFATVATGGTSLASPLIAGMAADAQTQAHLDRLGFLNPALYNMGKAGLDDVTPHQAGIYTPGMAQFGYVDVPTERGDYLIDTDTKPQTLQSGPGWDTVTGLGTPNSGFITTLGK